MSDTNKRRILVADDDPDIRVIINGVISLLGCDVIEAADGKAALEICSSTPPDLAILDIMMPEATGTEVCQAIKKQQGGTLIPVIMLTAKDSVQDKVDAFELGADDYLTKPFNYQELQARVKAHLRIRDLNLSLQQKNSELSAAQEKLVQQERQLLVMQLAGTAAHQLGQPLAAIMLNCHLLETTKPEEPKFKGALAAIKSDSRRMAEMIEKLKTVDAGSTERYFTGTDILDLEKSKP
ncbi:MAG: response regulator [Oligoflexia bacterium]|nr:response regulator [Oligoflexia bacterium]